MREQPHIGLFLETQRIRAPPTRLGLKTPGTWDGAGG